MPSAFQNQNASPFLKKDSKPLKAKGMRVITTDIAKAINTIILAGFSLRLVPYNMIEATMISMHNEINVPTIKVDKCSNTVVNTKPTSEIINPIRSISFKGKSNTFPRVFISSSP